MHSEIKGTPAFAYVHIDLQPGESVIAESDAMATMDADLDFEAEFNGGIFQALLRKFFGGESLFVNRISNNTSHTRRITLVQVTPGNSREVDLSGEEICFQPGAFIARTPNVELNLKWAGFVSWFAREGLFRLVFSGQGKVWYGAYGELLDMTVDGSGLIDTSHLVAYEPQLKLKLQLAGGLFSSFFGGEGFVTRVEGRGKVVIQTRSLYGLRDWINPKLRY